MRKKDRDLVSRALLLALFGGLFLMMGTIDEAEAWLMHQTNCKTIAEAKIEVSVELSKKPKPRVGANAGIRIECDTEFHWNPFPHGDDDDDNSSGSDSSSGSCDSADWCPYCEEEHWVCNFGTGWE